MLTGLGLAVTDEGRASSGRRRVPVPIVRHARAHDRVQPVPAPAAENLVVHGQKRFIPAPTPNQEIHDPADALRDPSTGAPIGRFGGAYMDADPVPPINPGLRGDQDQTPVGIPR
jgi:hypothetical protein